MKQLLKLIFLILSLELSINDQKGKEIYAYKSTPNPDELQFRMGNGLGGVGGFWGDAECSKASAMGGEDTQRKKLPESHFMRWGYDIETGDCKSNYEFGIRDVVGYLHTPNDNRSTYRIAHSEKCPPANMYEPIWLKNGTVNPNNYWADYVYKISTELKGYIKIWENFNEPDYTYAKGKVQNWETTPPEPDDLANWHGTIFEYIRLLRITYEVSKKVDPTTWTATGGIGYPEFLDAIMRYTDNPVDGSVTDEYPALGGAYFDCDCYHQYPQYGVDDCETGIGYHQGGSDHLALKNVILKKNHEYIMKKYGFGVKYPKKLYVLTETGVDSNEDKGDPEELTRRNWIIKSALRCIEYDVKQIHNFVINDDGNDKGDYAHLGDTDNYEDGFKKLKYSSKSRLTLQKIHIGKFGFDKKKTMELRNSLPENVTGTVLKRRFPKEENETYYSDYIYSVWIYCETEEVQTPVISKVSLPFDPLYIDWIGNEKKVSKNTLFNITSTPIYLLSGKYKEKNKLAGWIIALIVIVCIIVAVFLVFLGIFLYRKFVQKKLMGNNQSIIDYMFGNKTDLNKSEVKILKNGNESARKTNDVKTYQGRV